MSKPVVLTPVGGSSGNVSGGLSIENKPKAKINPLQVLGFIPLTDCDATECRNFNGECYINKVFGTVGVTKSTYENDLTSFFFSDALRRPVRYIMEKLNQRLNVWETAASLTNPSVAGTYYAYGSLTGHPYFQGVTINWGNILTLLGVGFYRLKIEAYSNNETIRLPFCLASETFHLLPFSCHLANRTVKFEAQMSGKIGSIDIDGYVFDLCKLNLYDSIRVPGFFGKEVTSYDSVELEYQTGLIDSVRDEAIQKFKFESKMLPKYIHDRFKAYGLMADVLLVSDYNFNNADYNIKQKRVVKNGSYEPIPYKGTRLSNVIVDFKEGIQGVIKTLSCG